VSDILTTLVPEGKLSAPSKKSKRQAPYSNTYLSQGDKPWYCFWNQTVEEFWIFLEKEASWSTASAAAAMTASSSASYPSGYPRTGSSSSPSSSATSNPTELALEAGPAMSSPTYSSNYGPKVRRKRASTTTNAFPAAGTQPPFPKLIKMVEKRKPHDNIDPYCQQMQVLDSWQVVPIPGVDIIGIDEQEFDEYAGGPSKRSNPGVNGQSLARRDENDIIADLESLCICEWRAG
jgi:hypothetical protein